MPFFRSKTKEQPNAQPQSEAPRWRFDVVEEVSPEFLRYLAETRRKESGKFIRIGADLVLAAGIPDPERPSSITHRRILELALANEDADFKQRLVGAQAIAAATGTKLLDESGIVDAGELTFELDENGNLKEVALEGYSSAFSSANREGRRQTAQVIQGKLGSEIEVINDDLGIPE